MFDCALCFVMRCAVVFVVAFTCLNQHNLFQPSAAALRQQQQARNVAALRQTQQRRALGMRLIKRHATLEPGISQTSARHAPLQPYLNPSQTSAWHVRIIALTTLIPAQILFENEISLCTTRALSAPWLA